MAGIKTYEIPSWRPRHHGIHSYRESIFMGKSESEVFSFGSSMSLHVFTYVRRLIFVMMYKLTCMIYVLCIFICVYIYMCI